MRVRVYAGQDPLTKKRHTLVETIPAGPLAKKQAEAVLDRMQREVADRRAPKTDATVDQLLERYLNLFDGSPNTLELYRTHARNHISPLLGHLKVGQLTPETLDSFYAELRRCRAHCTSRRAIDHRVKGDHECDGRCRKHVCKPLSPTTIRHIRYILSGACRRAVRRRWVSVSPTTQTEPPAAAKPNPQSPSPQEAARILNAAWRDPDWGTFLWVAMTTGARRGELCAIRWSSVNFEAGRETIWLRGAIRRNPGRWAEGGLKTHQQRRIALDPETVDALRVHRGRCEARAQALGIELAEDAYIFSGAAAGLVLPTPDSLTQRYDRMVRRLGINSTLPQAPALPGDRVDSQRRGRPYSRGPTGSWRRGHDDTSDLHSVDLGGRPASCNRARCGCPPALLMLRQPISWWPTRAVPSNTSPRRSVRRLRRE